MDQTDRAGVSASGPTYPQLVERALAFVEDIGQPVDEDRLVAHVFGNTTSPTLWRSLLRTILDGHPTLQRRPDGTWATRGTATTDRFPTEFVILDVETTGLKPTQQRIIEVAIIQVAAEGEPITWSTLVNPQRPIPAYVAGLTGIQDSDVASAPAFRSIAPTIIEMIADLPVVAHNAEFDLAFLNAELSRCGHAKLVNRCVDTLGLAQAVAPEARRLNLSDVAKTLGIAGGKPHRALADAQLTYDVLQALLRRAAAMGLHSLEEIQRLDTGRRVRTRANTPAGRGRAVLDRAHLQNIPNAPGVYVMRDRDDRVLYVGKAKDLRKRVGSYYSQPLGYTRKLDGLLESIDRIEVEVVGTELEALILESQLIRRYRPRFNTVQRNAEQYVYIRIDVANPWPRVMATKDRAADGAVYFGPFHSAGGVRDAIDLVNDVLPLRTCRRSFTDRRSYGSACIELSLKRCAGPCLGLADPDEYRGYVADVIAFFSGDVERLLVHLHRRLEDTVRTLDFERAARLRDQIQRVDRIVLEQVRLSEAARYGHALLVLNGADDGVREVWYLLHGQRWAVLRVDADCDAGDLAGRLEPIIERAQAASSSLVPNHHSVDEMALLSRWMRKSPDHEALIADIASQPPLRLAQRILAVDMTRPFGQVSHGEVDDLGTAGADWLESQQGAGGDPI